MWQEIKVIVVDDNAQRRRELQIIFDFLGETATCCTVAEWLEVVREAGDEDTSNVAAVVLGTSDQSVTLQQLLYSVREWDDGVPAMLLGEQRVAEDIDDDQ